jgi:hypothetical protein
MFMQERSKNDVNTSATKCDYTPTKYDNPVTKCDDGVTKNRAQSDAAVMKRDETTSNKKVENVKSTNPFETDFDDSSSTPTPTPTPTPTQSDRFSVQSSFSAEPISEIPKFPFVHVDSRDSVYENGVEATTVKTHLHER